MAKEFRVTVRFWAETPAGERVEVVQTTEYRQAATRGEGLVAVGSAWETAEGEHVRHVGPGEFEFQVWDGTRLRRLE